MPIMVHNTLTRQKEPLQTLHLGKVGIYLCGPTVYSDCHIGHLMGPVVFDAVARWLHARGFQVRLVNNITDIDDKIIDAAAKQGVSWKDIAERYTAQYFGFLQRLKVTTITDHPRCTGYVDAMIAYIGDLVQTGKAYVVEDDGVYFAVADHPGYGKLTGRRLEDSEHGARIERSAALRHPGDFALWKHAKPGEPYWNSPWGRGRPGWHIECSVMATRLLGDTFDIHAGGDDLKFPHHENEIAQGEAHGGGYACCWMHNGLLQYEGVKIGKSDARMKDEAFKRQFQAQVLLDTYGASTIRYQLLQGHYRRPTEFGPGSLDAARTALGKLHRQLGALMAEPGAVDLVGLLARPLPPAVAAARDAFAAAMDDDFATGSAIAQLFTLSAEAKRLAGDEQRAALTMLRDLGRCIGLFQPGDEADTQAAASGGVQTIYGVGLNSQAIGIATLQMIDALHRLMTVVLDLRQHARAARDFATSDRIRAGLGAIGLVVKDGKDGATWELTNRNADARAGVADLLAVLRDAATQRGDAATAQRIQAALDGR